MNILNETVPTARLHPQTNNIYRPFVQPDMWLFKNIVQTSSDNSYSINNQRYTNNHATASLASESTFKSKVFLHTSMLFHVKRHASSHPLQN